MIRSISLALVIVLLSSSCRSPKETADVLITNGIIWTGNESEEIAESMAIRGEHILAIGNAAQLAKYAGPKTRNIDALGKFIVPGFIDCHVHLISGGRGLLSVNLRDASTPEEFTRRIADFASNVPAGQWMLEGNWDHTLWGGELPDRKWIDEQTPNVPLILNRLDGHMALANSAALRFAGVDENTRDVEGGTIVRDATGRLTGILKDNAMNLVYQKIPAMSKQEKRLSFEAASRYLSSNGVTTVHDVDGMNEELGSFSTARELLEQDSLKIRIYAAGPLSEWKHIASLNERGDEWLKAGALKGFVDGSLGSHTAAFRQSYSDKKEDKGFFVNSQEDLYRWISEADNAGMHIMVHAIGDSAIHYLLNTYDRVIKENGAKDRRFRIEHAQHIAPEDISRFSALGVIPSMQPYHAIDDGRWAESYIGSERIKTSYAFRSLLDAGASLAFGSDWFVAPASPILGIYAAVTRSTLDDKNPEGWVPEQKISVQEALRAYTLSAAYASFDEQRKGSLEEGKLADFVILSDNILEKEPRLIRDVQVLETWVGGKQVFKRIDKQ